MLPQINARFRSYLRQRRQRAILEYSTLHSHEVDEDEENAVSAASKVETDRLRLGPDPGNRPDRASRPSESRCRV